MSNLIDRQAAIDATAEYLRDMAKIDNPSLPMSIDGWKPLAGKILDKVPSVSNIEILSELRAQFNCFDEVEEPCYRALSDAICALSEQPNSNETSFTHKALDTISRQAAIDAVRGRFSMPVDNLIVEVIGNLPSAQPEITDEQAIEHLQSTGWMQNHDREMYDMGFKEQLADDSGSYDSLLPPAQSETMYYPQVDGITPSVIVQPEIIRCKDCRWWDKCDHENGYCMAAKHGYWSEHWEINIRRTYKGDFYCADAEPKEEQEDE